MCGVRGNAEKSSVVFKEHCGFCDFLKSIQQNQYQALKDEGETEAEKNLRPD
jgi:hypothetical protein